MKTRFGKIDGATAVKCHVASFSRECGVHPNTLKTNPNAHSQLFSTFVSGAGDGLLLSPGERLNSADSFLSGDTFLCSHLPSQSTISAGLSVVCVSTDESGHMAGFAQRLPKLSNDHLRESKVPASVGHVLGDECIQQCIVPLKHTRKATRLAVGKQVPTTKKKVAHRTYHSIVTVSDLIPESSESLKFSSVSAVRGGGVELAPFMEIRLYSNCADTLAPILLQPWRRGGDTQHLLTLKTFVQKRLSCKCCSKTILKANLLPQPSSSTHQLDGGDWCLSCGFHITQKSTCRPSSTVTSNSAAIITTGTSSVDVDTFVSSTLATAATSIFTSVPFQGDLFAIASLVNTLYNFPYSGDMVGDAAPSHLPHCSCLACAPTTLFRRQQYDDSYINNNVPIISGVAEEEGDDVDTNDPIGIPIHLIAFLALHDCWNNADASSSPISITT